MYTIVWIRHAEKLYKNGRGPKEMPRHDPPILPNEEGRIRDLTKNLLKTYGEPNYLITSPFLRTRQTALHIYNELVYGQDIKIDLPKVDISIEEYLGYQRPVGRDASLDNGTKIYTNPKLGESMLELEERIKKHITNLNIEKSIKGTCDVLEFNKPNSKKKENIIFWVITHGIVIHKIRKEISKLINLSDDSDDTDPKNTLSGIILHGNLFEATSFKLSNFPTGSGKLDVVGLGKSKPPEKSTIETKICSISGKKSTYNY